MEYSNKNNKISRDIRDGKLFKVITGLYETDRNTPGYLFQGHPLQNRGQLGIDHIEVRNSVHDLVVHLDLACALQVPCQIGHLLRVGIVVADKIFHHHQQLFQRCGVFVDDMRVLRVPVGMGMGQTAVGVEHGAVMGVSQRIPLDTADLIHPAVGDHDLHIKVRVEELFQAVRSHETVGHLAGGAAVVAVDCLPAHAVGNGQPSALLQQLCKGLDQALGLGEMGKGIVDHDAVKFPFQPGFLHVAADHLHLGLFGVLPGGDLRHFRRNVDAGDGSHVPLQIVVEHNAGAAGYIQNVHACAHLGIVQNISNDHIAFDHLRIPAGCAAVKKLDDIFFLHGSFPPGIFVYPD